MRSIAVTNSALLTWPSPSVSLHEQRVMIAPPTSPKKKQADCLHAPDFHHLLCDLRVS